MMMVGLIGKASAIGMIAKIDQIISETLPGYLGLSFSDQSAETVAPIAKVASDAAIVAFDSNSRLVMIGSKTVSAATTIIN